MAIVFTLGFVASSCWPTTSDDWRFRVDRIAIWENGEQRIVGPQSPEYTKIGKLLIQTLGRLNLQARCVFGQERIDEIKQKDKVVELVFGEPIFREPVNITISQFIEPEERDHIATDENGYRILENVRTALFILEDNSNEGLEAHVLVGSVHEGKVGYGCWAITEKGTNELDKTWCNELSEAFGIHDGTSEQEFIEDDYPNAVSQEESREIARNYLLNSPTFKFGGMKDTLDLVATYEMICSYCWEFVFEFRCRRAGYGDRTGQILAEVITPHIAGIIVDQGEVVSAIMDEEWNMMRQSLHSSSGQAF